MVKKLGKMEYAATGGTHSGCSGKVIARSKTRFSCKAVGRFHGKITSSERKGSGIKILCAIFSLIHIPQSLVGDVCGQNTKQKDRVEKVLNKGIK